MRIFQFSIFALENFISEVIPEEFGKNDNSDLDIDVSEYILGLSMDFF